MKTTICLPNEWLSVDICEPEQDHTYLVKCKDGYITTGVKSGCTWWVYMHEKHENHPTGPSYEVTHFSELPTMGIFSGQEDK